jgi:hypothetical protein
MEATREPEGIHEPPARCSSKLFSVTKQITSNALAHFASVVQVKVSIRYDSRLLRTAVPRMEASVQREVDAGGDQWSCRLALECSREAKAKKQ